MAEHTPGPWHADVEGPFTLGVYSIEVEAVTEDGTQVRRSIATLMIDTEENDDTPEAKEDKANARLIAAAPELLAACAAMLPYLEEHEDRGPHSEGWQSTELREIVEQAHAAVAKATGVAGA